jgi:hypothetical protein
MAATAGGSESLTRTQGTLTRYHEGLRPVGLGLRANLGQAAAGPGAVAQRRGPQGFGSDSELAGQQCHK